MNLMRRIIEGIHEVELQVTPEFQKGWPAPKVWQRTSLSTDPSGHLRYRVVWRWPDATIATGLELLKSGMGYELNVWEPGSTVKPGSWNEAMASIKKVHEYGGGIYVYVHNDEDPIFGEISTGVNIGNETIDDKEPGEDAVVDHFLGYEAEPASVQQALAKGGQDVRMSEVIKMAIVNRPWMHVVKMNDDISELNPVMVLVDNIPGDAYTQVKKKVVQDKFEGLVFETFWAGAIGAWKVWPLTGQTDEEFEEQLGYLMNGIDAIIDAAEET